MRRRRGEEKQRCATACGDVPVFLFIFSIYLLFGVRGSGGEGPPGGVGGWLCSLECGPDIERVAVSVRWSGTGLGEEEFDEVCVRRALGQG
jgi:hypothetical protein